MKGDRFGTPGLYYDLSWLPVGSALLCLAIAWLCGACEQAGSIQKADQAEKAVEPPAERRVLSPAERWACTAPTAAGDAEQAEALLAAIDELRAAGGTCNHRTRPPIAKPLRRDARLGCAARGHAHQMGEDDFFHHVDPSGRGPTDRSRAAGYSDRVGENLAWGQASAEATVEAWVRSPNHCPLLFDASMVHAGAAYHSQGSHAPYWVLVLGTGDAHVAPAPHASLGSRHGLAAVSDSE